MVAKKKIIVFTSIRSEYGLLTPLLRAIRLSDAFELNLVAGGAHLLHRYGYTIEQIRKDGFPISGIIPFLSENESENTYSLILSRLHKQFGAYLEVNQADLLMVLGDRFELIPVVTTSLLSNIPIAHISGGEFTEGAVDNQIRHAVSKMSHLHFPATEAYKENLLRMGEEAWRVCVSGEPGIDEILRIQTLPKHELFQILGLRDNQPVVCCTFHPETISNVITSSFVVECLLTIVSKFDAQVLVTASNFDLGGSEINAALEQLSSSHNGIVYHKSLGQLKYYSVMKYADLMVGNSSSGIVEAKSFNLPVVNVGDRQKGRLSNPNVIHCKPIVSDIIAAMQKASDEKFRKSFERLPNIYGDGTAAEKIVSFLRTVKWRDLLTKRKPN